MPAPTHSELGALLDRDDLSEGQATAALGIVKSMASAYTRGHGFTGGVPNDEISAVILTAAARLVSHPRQVPVSETLGPQAADWRRGFDGWSLAELFVLNRYRERAR